MLYPLSYEGLRPISYLGGDTRECPGVPRSAKRSNGRAGGRFRRWSEHTWSTFGLVCPAVTAGAQR
jgi:hypothetical protein